jgi:CheY-like chemotaxis protein
VAADGADGAIALLMLQGLAPDAVVADYRLADGMSGADAIAALRERYGALPALLVTGEYEARGLAETHRDDYPVLQKPVSAARLKEALTASLIASMPRLEPAAS